MSETPLLNPQQREAVQTTSGPLLILAGAGAGKTKTITERIVEIVKGGISPTKVLAITFTNKSANEMRERIFNRLAEETSLNNPISMNERPFVSTFHALGVHIIKENARLLGLPRFFGIFDKGDSKQAMKEIAREIGLDPKQYDAAKLLGSISREKGLGVTFEQFEKKESKSLWDLIIVQVWRRYEQVLKKEHALDFDDLLLKSADLLEREEVRTRYQNIWSHIHIDEYQDTNGVQYRIVKHLAEKHKNICVVGDIDQNIYSWRGAQLKNILDFEKDYPGATVIILEENYRSTKTILAAANHIISKNTFRRDKNLFTKKEDGELISIFEGFDEVSEAEFVATQSEKLVQSGVKPEEIAVLYRANFQSRALEEAFLSYGVGYQLLGTKFFERKEVRDILAYIKAGLEPENLTDMKRIINVPTRGIGKVTLLKIFEGSTDSLSPAVQIKYKTFLSLLAKIGNYARTNKPSETVKFVLSESGIEEELKNGSDDDKERLENIKELVTLATRYDGYEGEEGIEKFLTDAALHSDQDELEKPREGVKLMTVHASKGLEFDYVFITGLEEGLFPHERDGAKKVATEESEEERRLFYVAITRARKKLFLTYAQMRTIFGSKQVNIPSEFIFDVPNELVQKEEGTYGLLRKPIFSIDF